MRFVRTAGAHEGSHAQRFALLGEVSAREPARMLSDQCERGREVASRVRGMRPLKQLELGGERVCFRGGTRRAGRPGRRQLGVGCERFTGRSADARQRRVRRRDRILRPGDLRRGRASDAERRYRSDRAGGHRDRRRERDPDQTATSRCPHPRRRRQLARGKQMRAGKCGVAPPRRRSLARAQAPAHATPEAAPAGSCTA